MSSIPLIEVYCAGNFEVGYGHIRRCKTLAAQLEKDGVDVCIFGLSDEARFFLPKPKTFPRMADLLLFDSPFNIESRVLAAHSRGQTTVTLDWFGEVTPDVNIAVYPHAEVRGAKKVHVGFEYILIREEILLQRRTLQSINSNKVLVVLGGGDLLNQGHEIAHRLWIEGLEVTLVQGPFVKNVDKGEGYRVLFNPPDLPQLLACSDWVVTNGGGCLFEAMYLGKATFVLPQTEKEEKIAQFAANRGAILGVGFDNLQAFSYAELGEVAEHASNLVDGLGVSRVSSIIRALM